MSRFGIHVTRVTDDLLGLSSHCRAADPAFDGGGVAVPVELTLTNPNDVPITITAITMRVTGASPAACAAVIAVAGQLAATPVLPAGSTRSLTALGIAQSAWPRLQMLDTASNQNACAQASIALEFTGSATG